MLEHSLPGRTDVLASRIHDPPPWNFVESDRLPGCLRPPTHPTSTTAGDSARQTLPWTRFDCCGCADVRVRAPRLVACLHSNSHLKSFGAYVGPPTACRSAILRTSRAPGARLDRPGLYPNGLNGHNMFPDRDLQVRSAENGATPAARYISWHLSSTHADALSAESRCKKRFSTAGCKFHLSVL